MVKLTVVVPSRDIFDAYWYGTGEVISDEPAVDVRPEYRRITVNYGDDRYRADYQEGRFASGLYFAQVTEEDDAPRDMDPSSYRLDGNQHP